MKLEDVEILNLPGHALLFSLKDFKEVLEDIPELSENDYMILWPFIEHEYGLGLALLGFMTEDGDDCCFEEISTDELIAYDPDELADLDFEAIKLPDENFGSGIIKMIPAEEADDKVIALRDDPRLNKCRDQFIPGMYYIDLEYDGKNEYSCWALAESVDGDKIRGIIKSDVDEGLGLSTGDEIVFEVRFRGGEYHCISRLENEAAADTIQDKHIKEYASDLIDTLTSLKNKEVFLMTNYRGEPISSSYDDGRVYLVFTEEDKLIGSPSSFSKDKFINIIERAKKADEDITGIVVDPFDNPFHLPRNYYEIAEALLA